MREVMNSKSVPWVVLGWILACCLPVSAQDGERRPAVPSTGVAVAADPENCLSCHRFRGLSRLDPETGELRLFFCSAEFYARRQGPHARLRCTDCHERSEVEVIPHQVKTPVNCTQTCHVVSATGVEIRFSHASVLEGLEQSVHAPGPLREIRFEPPLLRPGQSVCLYCHDQPVFRELADLSRPLGRAEVTARCDQCHVGDMPTDVDYFMGHVTARLQPARTIHQLLQVCAVCHSDPDVMAQIDSHDTVASYLHSFHGKAKLLGSRETATCLDCHASDVGDVHAMMTATHPDSPIHESRLSSTCRTARCHPGAPPAMSRAAVHLDLDPQARTLEYYVAAAFVTLTAAVMIVFLIYILLELVGVIFHKRDPEHVRLVRLARKICQSPEGRRLLQRLSPHERVQHWLLVIVFVGLVVTGMPIKFAESAWAENLIGLMGGLDQARFIHRLCGVTLMAGFAYHLVYLLVYFIAFRRKARRAGRPVSLWRMIVDAPMVITIEDVRHFVQLFAYLLYLRRERPSFGRFNFMQKFEYWAVFWGTPILAVSGMMLWDAARAAEVVSGRGLNFAYIVHSDESYLAFIYIAVVHIFSVILSPVVFPLSRGTLTGQAPAEEVVEGHREHLLEVAEKLGISVADQSLPVRTVGRVLKEIFRRVYAAGLVCLCGWISFASMRFLFLLLLTRQTAPADIVEIPKRLDADTLQVAWSEIGGQDLTGPMRPRAPLAHFHQVPNWFQPDPGNNCTTSDCHAPLPHGDRIEVRAFLNMHTTFVDCMVCHAASPGTPDATGWLDLSDRAVKAPPAILRLARRLEELGEVDAADIPAVSTELMALLDEAIVDSGDNVHLRGWRLRLETTQTHSPLWHSTLNEMRRDLPMHVHGEYNAKIGLRDNRVPSEDQKAAAKKWVKKRDKLSEPQQEALLETVHADVAPGGALCTPCHAAQPTLIDFDRLGYPRGRAASLQGSHIVQQVLSIEQGQPFHLPRVLEVDDER